MCGVRGTSLDWLSSYLNNIYQLCIMIAIQNVKNPTWSARKVTIKAIFIFNFYQWFTIDVEIVYAYLVWWWHKFVLYRW